MDATADATPAVYVIATTPPATSFALKRARTLAGQHRIVLLVPAVVDREEPADLVRLMREYDGLAARLGIVATPYVCVCKQPRDVLSWFPTTGATLVVGGARGGRFFHSEEERLARALQNAGHHVVFVNE
jgi:hypothetical protein